MKYLQYLTPVRTKIEQFMKTQQATPCAIPAGLELQQATLQQESIQMKSFAWENERYQYMRLTHLTSEAKIEMLNFTIYPHYRYSIPVFASDFVIMNHQLRIALMDAMPIFPAQVAYKSHWIDPFETLYKESLKLAPRYQRKLDWSFDYLSPYACLATNVVADQLAPVYSLWMKYIVLYSKLAFSSSPLDATEQELVKTWHCRYNRSHLEVEKQRNPLMHYFGKEIGEKYHREFLFKEIL